MQEKTQKEMMGLDIPSDWVLVHSMNGVRKTVRAFDDLSIAYESLQAVQGCLFEEGRHHLYIKNSISDEILIERILTIE